MGVLHQREQHRSSGGGGSGGGVHLTWFFPDQKGFWLFALLDPVLPVMTVPASGPLALCPCKSGCTVGGARTCQADLVHTG